MVDAEEQEILFPDIDLELAGSPVKVSEYRFIDGLKVEQMAQPLLKDMGELFAGMAEGSDPVDLAAINALFCKDPALIVELIALSTGEQKDWIEGLSDEDGQLLMMTWWRVNKDFFVRRLVTGMVARRQAAELQASLAAEDVLREGLIAQALDLAGSPLD